MRRHKHIPTPQPVRRTCFTCRNRERAEWNAVDGEELARLDAAKTPRVYEPGTIVFHQGDPCEGIHCIESGSVALRKTDARGESLLLGLAHAGQTLGYRAYFSGEGYSVSAECLEPSTICQVERRSLEELLRHNPALGLNFLAHVSRELERAQELLLERSTLPVRQRLAHLLLTLKDRYATVRRNGDLILWLPMSRRDLADLLGARPETVARAMQAMQRDGVARFAGRRVVIPDLDVLLDDAEAS